MLTDACLMPANHAVTCASTLVSALQRLHHARYKHNGLATAKQRTIGIHVLDDALARRPREPAVWNGDAGRRIG